MTPELKRRDTAGRVSGESFVARIWQTHRFDRARWFIRVLGTGGEPIELTEATEAEARTHAELAAWRDLEECSVTHRYEPDGFRWLDIPWEAGAATLWLVNR